MGEHVYVPFINVMWILMDGLSFDLPVVKDVYLKMLSLCEIIILKSCSENLQ